MFRALKEKLAPPDYKKLTRDLPIKAMPAPKEAVLPLLQHTGAPCQPKVAVGDQVKLGTVIGAAEAGISAPVHSSVSGTVKAIETRPHPVLGEYQAIVIESDGQDVLELSIQERQNPTALSADQLRQIIRNCGLVGLGGAAFPTHVKLTPPQNKPVDSFILNGAECEPYLTADYRLMLERPLEIISGVKIAMKILNVSSGFVAIEENKPEAIKMLKSLIDSQEIKVVPLKSFYPQGAEKQLIKAILKRQVPAGGLPFDVGVVVNNVATCCAIYEAVYKNKPLYERVLTVSGSLVNDPANLQVRFGAKVQDIIEYCGGLKQEAGKIILGGPMMGVAQYTAQVPVIKSTSGILVFSEQEAAGCVAQPCIRCGRCLQICPMGINPSAIAQAIEKGQLEQARELGVLDCIECGICSFACPGNRDVVGLVKLAKQRLKE